MAKIIKNRILQIRKNKKSKKISFLTLSKKFFEFSYRLIINE